jgi:hypothetical protein
MRPAIACIMLVLATSVPASAQPIETFTPKDIADAIHLGTNGEPEPYLVHNFERPPEEVNQGVLAVLYTPFVRVALAAKAATEKGITFEPSDATAEMIEAGLLRRVPLVLLHRRSTWNPRGLASEDAPVQLQDRAAW